jgi:hypothetical protein
MGRRAVAATIASVVVFTTLLLANAVFFSAENSYLSATNLSSAQLQERDDASLILGLSAYDSLARTQSFLQSTPMECSSSQSYLAALSGDWSADERNQSVWYSADASWAYASESPPAVGNALLPSQFNGYSAGDLNLLITTSVNESFVGGLPSYSIKEDEVVHLSVQPERVAAECVSALSALRGALSIGRSCNASLIAGDVSSAQARSALTGSFTGGASVSPAARGCVVDYWVTMTQTGVQGVSGTFPWTVFGSGSLSLLLPAISDPSAT